MCTCVHIMNIDVPASVGAPPPPLNTWLQKPTTVTQYVVFQPIVFDYIMFITTSLVLMAAEEGHSILPISAFPSLMFTIWAFPIWTFQHWAFQIWAFSKSEHKFSIPDLNMIRHSPMQRVQSLLSIQIVKQFHWLAQKVNHETLCSL